MGYDISDYRAIYSPYGIVKNVEQIIAGLHARNMRLLLDLVVNHTSDQVGNLLYPLAHFLSSKFSLRIVIYLRVSANFCSMSGSNNHGLLSTILIGTTTSGESLNTMHLAAGSRPIIGRPVLVIG